MEQFSGERDYLEVLTRRAVLPRGFRVSVTRISFTPKERPTEEPYAMNLALLLSDNPTDSFAGVFTRNQFPGAPVILGRERMAGEKLQGIIVNNKIANVCSQTGVEDARTLTDRAAALTGSEGSHWLSVSTGIIGWSLPVAEMSAALEPLVDGLHSGDALDVARAIMTTDSFPKVRSRSVGEGRVLGIAKGAGMIEPNMATMLVFLLTDIDVDREDAQRILQDAAEHSFNRISVDSDQSTSDMAVLLSSRHVQAPSLDQFAAAVNDVCRELASDIVRNGEGTSHVMRVAVSGLPDERTAVGAGKAIVNSPLVKTAIFGNDPNVGRLVSALGDFTGNNNVKIDRSRVAVYLGNESVFRDGAFHLDKEKEVRLSEYLKMTAMNPRLHGYPQHDRFVDIKIDCGTGSGSALVLGSDLSHEYVRENADYRT